MFKRPQAISLSNHKIGFEVTKMLALGYRYQKINEFLTICSLKKLKCEVNGEICLKRRLKVNLDLSLVFGKLVVVLYSLILDLEFSIQTAD
jgi:hypothetical protein